MKKLALLIPILMGLVSYAQTRYAYLPEGITKFETSYQKIVIGYRDGRKPIKTLIDRVQSIVKDTEITKAIGVNNWNVFTLDDIHNNIDSLQTVLSFLRTDTTIAYANPFLIYKDGTLEGLTDRVNVRVKASADLQKVDSLYTALNVYIVKSNPYTPREYFLTIHPKAQMDAMDVADSLFNTGLFDYSEPDFIVSNGFKTIDPLFTYQWFLQNTGQYNGTAGADIKAPAAWCTATGSGIKIAILDGGVDLNHPDLKANLLPGYDALDQGTNGGPVGDDAHGTACAGIAAAVTNNSLGVAGTAYNSKIVPVRVGAAGYFFPGTVAVGIGWAASATGGNADILSCSFGGGSTSSSLNTAIANAISTGRAGKGCVVVFASGDAETGTIEYPANQPGVLAVGGTNMCDQRITIIPSTPPNSCNYDTRLETYSFSGGSSYGTGLGVVAPGINIATTDISGTPGFSDIANMGWEVSGTDYVLNFDGTSASTPQVAGVLALILSCNPSLGSGGAIGILEKTADKVGGYGYASYLSNGYWDPQMGYGRINAASAVAMAVSSAGMTGPSYLCSGSSTYSVAVPLNITTTWSVSGSNATLSCTTCASTTLTAVTKGEVTLTATFANSCGALPGATLTKNIFIKENPVTVSGTPGACSGTTQTWVLAAPPESGSNWSWTVTSGTGIYIYSPTSPQTNVDVTSGGGVTLNYKDLCSVSQQAGVTVYSECGGEEVIMAPNPANSMVTIMPATNSTSEAESSSIPVMEETGVISVNADSIQVHVKNAHIYHFTSVKMVKFIDANGRVHKIKTYSSATRQVNIDITDLSPGMYFVQIFDDNHFVTKKLVIQK